MKRLAIEVKAGVLAQKDNKLLLIKERNNSNKKFYWNIIKGTFNPDIDKDVIETATRELKEEAGVKLKKLNFLNVIFLKKKEKIIIQFNFSGEIKNIIKPLNKKQPRKNLEYIKEIKLFNKKEIKRLKLDELMNKRTFFLVKNWGNNNNNFRKSLINF